MLRAQYTDARPVLESRQQCVSVFAKTGDFALVVTATTGSSIARLTPDCRFFSEPLALVGHERVEQIRCELQHAPGTRRADGRGERRHPAREVLVVESSLTRANRRERSRVAHGARRLLVTREEEEVLE